MVFSTIPLSTVTYATARSTTAHYLLPTLLIENGVSPKVVQERLGHKGIETTLQTYVHNTDVLEENAMGIFDKVVNDAF